MTYTSNDFDWGDVEDNIVQQAVAKVAIYHNPARDVVIRQEQQWDEDRDTFIVISRGYALRAAYAILDAAGLGEICFHRHVAGGFEDVPIQASVASLMASRPDIDWEAVNAAADAAGLSDERGEEERATEHVPVKERRARVIEALKANPQYSNRSIAADCGVSDKTVAAVRSEIGEQGAEVEPNSAEFRREENQFRLIAAE